MSDYNRQFLFEEPMVIAKPKKPSLRQRLAKRTTFFTATAAIVLSSLVGGAVGAGVGISAFSYLTRPAPIVVNNTESVNWVTAAAGKASPSVVTISVSSGSDGGNGSGVVLTADGFILTNTHVVTLDGVTANPAIEVKTADGHVYAAKVVGTDPTNDLAVIKVSANINFMPVTFADSNKINVGDSVVAIGAPLGLQNTVTKGIVSALNRTIQVASAAAPNNSGGTGLQLWSGGATPAVNLSVIQTDAAINPGNSGGALINSDGDLVGINVAIATAGSSNGGQSGSIGVGFSIPSNIAKRIAQEIIKTGKASHALLGAMVVDSNNSKASASFSIGALIKELTAGGAAEKGGLKVGDIVVKFNDTVVTSSSELTAAVRQEPAGAEAKVTVQRGDSTLVIDVTLGDAANLK